MKSCFNSRFTKTTFSKSRLQNSTSTYADNKWPNSNFKNVYTWMLFIPKTMCARGPGGDGQVQPGPPDLEGAGAALARGPGGHPPAPWGCTHLDVVAPVLQQRLLAAPHSAEQLVHLREVRHSVLVQKVVQP